MTGPYDDIIGMEHHVSQRHPRMGRLDRAAQFSPFAALSGYEEAIEEAARLTERRPILSEDARAALDEALSSAAQGDEVSITYFREDSRKSGGSCILHHRQGADLQDRQRLAPHHAFRRHLRAVRRCAGYQAVTLLFLSP